MNIQFGTGVLYGNPVLGNQPTNPTPFKFGVIQEATIDFKGDLKKLFGQYQFPVATARGKIEVMVKAKLAVFDPNMLNQLFFAQTGANIQSNYYLIIDGEKATNVNTYTAAHTPLLEDWGVIDQVTGQNYINNVSIGTTGYSVNLTSGVYTFNTNVSVAVSYTYNVNAGVSIILANQLMGYAPELRMLLYNKFRTKYFAIELNDVTLGNISIPTKLEDFWIADIEGSGNADATNTVGRLMMDLF